MKHLPSILKFCTRETWEQYEYDSVGFIVQ